MKLITGVLAWTVVGVCLVVAQDYTYLTGLFGGNYGGEEEEEEGEGYDEEDEEEDEDDEWKVCLSPGSDMEGLCTNPEDCEGTTLGAGNCSAPLCCCVDGGSCGANSTNLVAYFTSPGYPKTFNSDPNICSFQVCRYDGTICKVRVDFVDTDIAPPNNGTCNTDRFEAEDLDKPLCGLLTGSTIYLEFKKGTDTLDLNFITDPDVSYKRKWKLKVTQIPCEGSEYRGCLQEYKDTTSRITSFNYRGSQVTPKKMSTIPKEATEAAERDMTNMQVLPPSTRKTRADEDTDKNKTVDDDMINISYTICVHLQPGFCSVVFDEGSPFHVGKEDNNTMPCNTTLPYVFIPNEGKRDRFCGEDNFPKVISTQKPVVISVRSKTDEEFRYPGFSLSYRQKRCKKT